MSIYGDDLTFGIVGQAKIRLLGIHKRASSEIVFVSESSINYKGPDLKL